MPEVGYEVSGRDGVTLVQAIDDGSIPKPKLMKWNEFQVWRRKAPQGAIDYMMSFSLINRN